MSDLIERQAAITIPVTPKKDREYQTYNLDDVYEQAWEDLQKKIEQLPSADAIPIEWIREYAKRFDNDRGHSVQVAMDYAIESMLAEWNWEKENGKDSE